jgi:hypothetical protein
MRLVLSAAETAAVAAAIALRKLQNIDEPRSSGWLYLLPLQESSTLEKGIAPIMGSVAVT